MKANTHSDKFAELNQVSTSSSLVARAGQIMAVIIAFGLISMISSMLVSESLSGDAAQINHAGGLRMQAMRVSRSQLMSVDIKHQALTREINEFDERLTFLFSGGLTSARENPQVEAQYQKILVQWKALKQTKETIPPESFDKFVATIDELVMLLQLESEKKLSFLRLIQGVGLLSIMIISFIVLIRLNRTIIAPLKQLVKVAAEAGKGNFNLKADYNGDDELGVLAHTINQMSQELQSTYQDFEARVAQKTKELTLSNRSLQVFYYATNKIASNQYQQTQQQIITELESVLGLGKISIERLPDKQNGQTIQLVNNPIEETFCFRQLAFRLEKQSQVFGTLVWQFPKSEEVKPWQTQMLQTMADIIATAMELEQKRNTDNRLLIIEERAVIARELHDSLAQSLSYLKVQMSLLTRKMQKNVDKEQISETIEDIKQGLNSAYLQLRELLTTFRLKLEDPSFQKAIQGTIAEFNAKCQHPIRLDFLLPANYLSANQEIHVLQIIREALSNIQRHANASQAGVSLSVDNDRVKVAIWDDGIGLPEEMPMQGHFGLGIMEERAKSLNSMINLGASKQQGTQISFEFEPLK